jgi:polyribonucleotide nucleotidyltransferase
MIIGSGGKKIKSIIEETGVESIDTQDDGIVSPNNVHFFLKLSITFGHSCTELVWEHPLNFCCNLVCFILVQLFQVKITAKDMSSIEKSKELISNITMVPSIGDIFRFYIHITFYFNASII